MNTPTIENIEWLAIPLGPEGPAFPSSWLSCEELARRNRFHDLQHASYWEQARTSLRFVLASILQTAPPLVPLQLELHGKPFVQTDPDVPPLHFNLSHTRDLAVIAWSRTTILGVDVEAYRDIPWQEMARSTLTPRELETGQALPMQSRSRFFLECWTAKEALLKGLGIGIAAGTHGIELDLSPSRTCPRAQSIDTALSQWIADKTLKRFPKLLAANEWQLASLPVGSCHVATLAVHARTICMHRRSIDTL